MQAKEKIIVALDVSSLKQVEPLVETLSPYVGYFKVGLELITSEGAPQVVDFIHKRGGKLFFDGKFSDIPNTIAKASLAASRMGVTFFDVHANCGFESMKAAASQKGNSKILAVTVLTSLSDEESLSLYGEKSSQKVVKWALEAQKAGVDGIVCSGQELRLLATYPELKSLIRVTPGIRPLWASAQDQKRVLTPKEAIQLGANYLVIGRPITNPPTSVGTPTEAAKKIAEEISEAL
jgi:orotidine-5'-phosphate decarboxylase